MELHDWQHVATIIKVAMAAGGRRVSPTVYEWDVSNGCSDPVLMSMTGRPEALPGEKYVSILSGSKHTLTLEMWVACRKCAHCLRRRRRLWTMRAAAEVSQAQRTWFVTLTIAPARLYQCEVIAQKRDVGYDTLPQESREKARFAVIFEELQKFMKRIRKNSKAKLRYLLVQELHKSGAPHYHMLIHEVEGTLTKAVLQSGWTWGFSSAKLSEPSRSIYVCKYLNKTEGARVRASLGYGRRKTVYSQSEA